jgi:hypothetical protein
VTFGRVTFGRVTFHRRTVGIFYGLLLYFMDIWHSSLKLGIFFPVFVFCVWYSSLKFGIFFPVLVFCATKNLATLAPPRFGGSVLERPLYDGHDEGERRRVDEVHELGVEQRLQAVPGLLRRVLQRLQLWRVENM